MLTQAETEELCQLYLDCKLSVGEETELQYVLGKLPYASPVIDNVRALMGLQSAATLKLSPKADRIKRRREWNIRWVVGIAASVAILLGVSLKVASNLDHSAPDGAVYIAYSNGVRLTGDQMMAQIERDNAKAEAFMRRMDEIEAEETRICNDFFND